MPVINNDPFGEIRTDKGRLSPSPAEVSAFHERSDKDSSINAQHHTIGTQRNQVSSGAHTHDGTNSKLIGTGEAIILTGAKGGNVALANLITMLQNWISFTDSTT